MKNLVLLLIVLIIGYLLLDYQTYYYGMSKGWLSEKIPKEYYLDYGTFDKESPSLSLMKKDMDLFMISNGKDICLDIYCHKNIYVKEFLGYYFNKTDVIVEILDNNFSKHYLQTALGLNFKEVQIIEVEKYKYINLKNRYIGFFLFMEYLCLFFISLILIYFIWKLFREFIGSIIPNGNVNW